MDNHNVSVVHTGKLPMSNDPLTILSWCPQLNLIFKVMNKTSIWCYRIDGERIFSINNRSIINNVAFSSQEIFLSGIDGKVKVYDVNNGNFIDQISQTFNSVQYMQWCDTPYRLRNSPLSGLPEVDSKNGTMIDKMEYLAIADGESITINFNKLLNVNKANTGYRFMQRISNDMFNQIYLDDANNLLSVDINVLLKQNYVDLIILICQVQKYLDMLQDTTKTIRSAIEPFVVLLDRYLHNFADEDTNGRLTSSTFSEILLTRLVPESTKDFWVNQVGERGIKRLSKLATFAYKKSSELIGGKLVSLMEKVILLLSRLLGISKWENVLNIDLSHLELLLNYCKLQLKFYYQITWEINGERDVTAAFISWWKIIVDALEEEEWKENYSTLTLLQFIQDGMLNLKVSKYFKFSLQKINRRETKESGQEKGTEREFLATSHEHILQQFEQIKKSVDRHHAEIISVRKIQKLEIPSQKGLQLSSWNNKIVISYLTEIVDLSTNMLTLCTPSSTISTIPNIIAYEHRLSDLIALTATHILIINLTSSVSIPLPTLDFKPCYIRLSSSYILLTDAAKLQYAILQID